LDGKSDHLNIRRAVGSTFRLKQPRWNTTLKLAMCAKGYPPAACRLCCWSFIITVAFPPKPSDYFLNDIMIADADGQFIFKENEFEDEAFVAASFVAKYRKVSSLESLKDQLMQYSNTLKQQLYNIINRDYKDFITISTKVRRLALK
jgi:hypothetical protein